MIVMALHIDNLCGFKNFNVNFSYPKKVVHSSLNETLKGTPNFRYKKVNVVMGTNASGKTTLGRVMMGAFNFIARQNTSLLKEMINRADKMAALNMDFIPDGKNLYRVKIRMDPDQYEDKRGAFVRASLAHEAIRKTDNYEKCAERLSRIETEYKTDFTELFKDVPAFGWLFGFPEDSADSANIVSRRNKYFPDVLKTIMMTLDNSIESVEPVNVSDGSDYLIKYADSDETILIHNGAVQDSDLSRISSGTAKGVRIASFISEVKSGTNGFYFCDELFPFIQTDIETAVLSLLSVIIKENEQLFFTSHDPEVLDANLPKHSFLFIRKDRNAKDCPIDAIDASVYIKKNNLSVRRAAESDLFSTKPDVTKIFEIEDM